MYSTLTRYLYRYFIALFLILVFVQTTSRAQGGLDVVIEELSVCNDTRCCMVFTLSIPAGVTISTLNVQLSGLNFGSDACFDWDCFLNQGGALYTYQGWVHLLLPSAATDLSVQHLSHLNYAHRHKQLVHTRDAE